MIRKLYFVTTSLLKFQQVKEWIYELDPSIVIEQKVLDIPEIQSLNLEEVALEKAKIAYQITKCPILVDDEGLYLEQYNNFPGPLTKYVFHGIGAAGLWKLTANNPRSYFKNCLIYIDGHDSYKIFTGICKGKLVEPAGANQNWFNTFIPDNIKSTNTILYNLPTKSKNIHQRHKSLISFFEWFQEHQLNQ